MELDFNSRPPSATATAYRLQSWPNCRALDARYAHRVAHLLLHGADPGRILLTFSRRAAAEMGRQAESIVGASREQIPVLAEARSAGRERSTLSVRGSAPTRARLPSIPSSPSAIARPTSNLVRHELGLSDEEKRFHVLVDGYQDTNALEVSACPPTWRLCPPT